MSEHDSTFAVKNGTPLPRSNAYTPRSAGWTLYRPEDLAEKLGVGVSAADVALEETGFNKAVRIREELIKWKERLRMEERTLAEGQATLRAQLREIDGRLSICRTQLANVRNILRLPREKGQP